MNYPNLRGPFDGAAAPGAFEPRNAPPMPAYTGSPNSNSLGIGAHYHQLPEIEQAEERLAAAKADLEQLTVRQNAIQAAAAQARGTSNAAIWKRTPEIEALANAKKEFAAALLTGGAGADKIQHRMSESQLKIDTLTSVSEDALKEAKRVESTLQNFSSLMIDARKRLEDAELKVFIKQYAALLPPLIAIAKEICRRTPHSSDPSYLLDVRNPKIGRYVVADSGELSFQA
jgi:hypothetical protein